jgi:hypothetical protein
MYKFIIIFILLNSLGFCQSGSIPINPDFRWKSEWVLDTVLYDPLNTKDAKQIISYLDCDHDWVKQNVKPTSYISCSVLHDSRGCPDKWGLEEWICRKCLRWVRMKENRVFIEQPKSEFEQLKDKIKELNGHN